MVENTKKITNKKIQAPRVHNFQWLSHIQQFQSGAHGWVPTKLGIGGISQRSLGISEPIMGLLILESFELTSGASNIEMLTMFHVPQKWIHKRWRPPSLMLATCNGLRLRESMSGERWPHFFGKKWRLWKFSSLNEISLGDFLGLQWFECPFLRYHPLTHRG